jgi:hypothetical protein
VLSSAYDAAKTAADASTVATSFTAIATLIGTVDTVVDAILVDTGTSGVVIADGAITAAKFGAGAIDAAAIANGAIDAATFASGAINAAALATDAVAEIADGVWDEAIAGHLGAGSTGAALNAAGSAGDPWTTPIPGAYGAGTAGFIVGTNLDIPITDVPTAVENADALLNRDMSAVTDSTARSPLNALRFLRNKWSVAAGTLTVTKENDVTAAWTAAISSDASANPIIGSDPT